MSGQRNNHCPGYQHKRNGSWAACCGNPMGSRKPR
jgi:hypothetical protein